MEVATQEFKRTTLVAASGRIDSGTTPQLDEAFKAITEDGRFNIVFDMSGVDFISSAGLRVLIDAQKTCKRFNRGRLVLTNVPERIYDALDLAGFSPLFELFDSTTEAVGSL